MPRFDADGNKIENAKVRAKNKARDEVEKQRQVSEERQWDESDPKVKKALEKKQREQREAAEKAAQRIAAKQERDAALKAEQEQIAKEKSKSKPKLTTSSKPVTRAQIALTVAAITEATPSSSESKEEPLEENRNREVDVDDVNARSLDDAIDQMSVGETDKHPEKRRKALFAAYEERELPSMKAEYPSLKLQQIRHMIFERWLKSPENPANQIKRQ